MAIAFSYDRKTDLAVFTLDGSFNLNEWIDVAEAGAFRPASLEIVDLRRCRLDGMRSMDLANFTRYLRSAMDSGRMIPGKTAILAAVDGPLRYNPVHRLFHNFSIFAVENDLPRDFRLFPTLSEALDWMGNPPICNRHVSILTPDSPAPHAGPGVCP